MTAPPIEFDDHRPRPADDGSVYVKLRIYGDTADRVRRLALVTGMPRTWVYNRLLRLGLGLDAAPALKPHLKGQTS